MHSPAAAKILIVDPHEPNRRVYRSWLGALDGVDLVEATGSPHALEIARDHDLAMVLLDVAVPGVDGFELAVQLRRLPRSESTPIVFVGSDSARGPWLLHGYRLGAADFMMTMPVPGEMLVQKARVFVELFRRQRALQEVVEQMRRENRELHARLERFVRDLEAKDGELTHDPVTQLPTRLLLKDRLGAAVARSVRKQERLALAYVELDGVAIAAAQRGPAAARAVVVESAERLTRFARATDTVARVGDASFVVLFEGLESFQGAEHVVRKLHNVLAPPVPLAVEFGPDAEAGTGVSVGVVLCPDHAQTVEELEVIAQMTLQAVRNTGGGMQIYPGHLLKGPRQS